MATKSVSNSGLRSWLSDAWPRTRQKRALEERNSIGTENQRLSAVPAVLIWIVLSVLLWAAIAAAVALIV